MTGLPNRRAFEADLEAEAARALHQGDHLSVLNLDLDLLKSINDNQGHERGDALLRTFARSVAQHLQARGKVYRVGGDEFAVIMPESTSEDASQLFERMHAAVSTMTAPGGQRVRVSAGIAELRHGETAAGLFERADKALYRAKDEGKDRSTVASE